jgi:hypothetical protein
LANTETIDVIDYSSIMGKLAPKMALDLQSFLYPKYLKVWLPIQFGEHPSSGSEMHSNIIARYIWIKRRRQQINAFAY